MNDDELSPTEMDAKVEQFREIAGADLNEDLCISLLIANSWSVEATVRQFFENPHTQQQHVQDLNRDDEEEEEEESTYGDEQNPLVTRRSTNNSEEEESSEGSFNGPLNGVRARRRISPENEPQSNMNRRSPPAVVQQQQQMSISSLLCESMFGAQDSNSAASMARKFAVEFDRIVGPNSPVPQFFESSFDDALLAATRERRMLCIYLHSPYHPASEQFCKNIVCSRAVLQALNDVRMWGGSVETCDGYLASSKLQCSAFPALVLLNCTEGDRDLRIIDRIYWNSSSNNGVNEAERIAAQISAARNLRQAAAFAPPPQQRAFGAQQQQQQQQDAFELAERRRMVQEQDAALRRAMEDDARREEEKLRLEREEQEQRARAAEAAEQERLALQAKQASVLPEPAPGGKQIATLRFNLPGGQKWSRRFLDTDTVGYVRLVLTCYLADQGIKLNFALSSNYPKRIYDNDDDTLEAAKLLPQAALFVQDLDA